MVVVLLMLFHVVNGATDDSQRVIEPVWPDKVKLPGLLPVHMLLVPLIVPPTLAGSTVTVVKVAVAAGQGPLCTTARTRVVAVRFGKEKVFVELVLLHQSVNGSAAYSHLKISPVYPDKVKVPELAPEQILVPPLTAPPTDNGEIKIW